MTIPWEGLAHIEHFLQLNFIFSGLEVSSQWVFAARMAALLILGTAVIWAAGRIIVKALECFQTLFSHLGSIPTVVYLLVALLVPLSPDTVAARWLGYILVCLLLVLVTLLGVVALVAWKYGVDQAIRFLSHLRRRSSHVKSATEPPSTEAPAPAPRGERFLTRDERGESPGCRV